MDFETIILDYGGANPLDLANNGSLRLSELVIPPAQKLPVWVKAGDGDGGQLVREPHFDTRQCTMRIRVMAASMDAGLDAIGLLEAKLQEAEKLQDGMPVLWSPAGASAELLLYLVYGQITDFPVTVADGWFLGAPIIGVEFVCKPFLYGLEIAGTAVTSTAPVVTVTVPSVPGDVPAEARLVLTDGSSQVRRWAEWGLQQRHYDAATSLLIDSEDLVVSGFTGAQATRTGGYRRASATHDTVSATLVGGPSAVCGTGNLTHVGTFRLKARVWATSINQYWRLSWQTGDGDWYTNDYAQPVAPGAFNELDLGIVTIQPVQAGGQKWSARVEAYTTTVAGEVGEVDYLILYPVEEGFGRIVQSATSLPTTVAGFDSFDTGQVAGAALNARTAMVGGAWATSGATTDFTAYGEAHGTLSESRSTILVEAGPRFAILGSTSYTASQILFGFYASTPYAQKSLLAILRWVDASNYAFARLDFGKPVFSIGVVVATVKTTLAISVAYTTLGTLTLTADTNGQLTGRLGDAGNNQIATLSGNHASVATGGALATGKPGFADQSFDTLACTRKFDNINVQALGAEQVVINSGRTLEVRSDSNLRQSTDGLSYGTVVGRGSRLFIPQAGDENRTARIVARATRANLATSADTPLGDSLTAQVFVTPRYLAVPR